MIPLSDNNPHSTKPYVTSMLIALFTAVFAFEFWADANGGIDPILLEYGLVPNQLDGNLKALITYQFLHASWFHILPNLLFLWIFGDNIEDAVGHKVFIIFFLLMGILSGLVHSGLTNFTGDTPLIGASGSISAVLGAYFALYPKAKVRMLFPTIILAPPLLFFGAPLLWYFNMYAWVFLGLWFSMDIYQAFMLGSDQVAFWTHISGFIFGFVLIRFIKRKTSTAIYDRSFTQHNDDKSEADLKQKIRRRFQQN